MIDFRQARWLIGMTAAFGAALGPVAAAAEAEDTALTVYSSALPGAVPAELYRPLPGAAGVNAQAVPGYALVRQDRVLNLERGRSSVKFSDVAALIDPTTVTRVWSSRTSSSTW